MTYSSEERRIRTCIYKSLTVQPAPRVKTILAFTSSDGVLILIKEMKIRKSFFLNERLYF